MLLKEVRKSPRPSMQPCLTKVGIPVATNFVTGAGACDGFNEPSDLIVALNQEREFLLFLDPVDIHSYSLFIRRVRL